MSRYEAIVVGGGHNGLVCAIFLARAGVKVLVLEDRAEAGGACKTEKPFQKVPNLVASTGAYLMGLMPPELIDKLGIKVPLIKRKPHYFLPTRKDGYLLLGAGDAQEQFDRFFSHQDWLANVALQEELAQIREDIAPAFLKEPLSVEAAAQKYLRPSLQKIFINLCRGSVGAYLDRFPFRSELLKAMYAGTDGFTGLYGTWDTPGSGYNFLLHNMCRLPDCDGCWMSVEGGMGTITRLLVEQARKAGVEIRLNSKVASILRTGGNVEGVALADGTEYRAPVVICNCDPFRMRQLAGGADTFDTKFNQRLDEYAKLPGTSFKLNMVLKRLPTFTCLREDRGQFRTTIHLLPEGPDIIGQLIQAFKQADSGQLPDQPLVEWYFNPSLTDNDGRHSSALFVQWAPNKPQGGWEANRERFVARLLAIMDQFAPGTSDLVEDTLPLSPMDIEQRFGITGGHICHVDHRFAMDERLPYAIPSVNGLYACGSGCHPGGGVTGAPGYVASTRILKDLGLKTA